MGTIEWTRQVAAGDLRHFLPYFWFALAFLVAFLLGALIFYFVGRYHGQLESPRKHEKEWLELQSQLRQTEAARDGANRVVANQAMVIDRLTAALQPEVQQAEVPRFKLKVSK